jgi:phosphoglucosamine mutase
VQKRFFGTDGIRGRVGQYPITAEFVLKLGWAVGRVLAPEGGGKVLIGKDTRISGYMFESSLQAGLSAAGVNVRLLGPMPTPAIAYLTRTLHCNAGIVISASHNPYYDNGLKFFSAEGKKLPDEIELAIEAAIDMPMETVDSARLGKAERVEDAPGRYIEFCKSTIPWNLDFSNRKIIVDCAHGATYHVAPSVFRELGATVVKLGVAPDGLNINDHCGSTHTESLQKAVLEQHADIGIALDGDGDRVIMIDHKGEIVDGDELLFIIARSRQRSGQRVDAVVGTLMSNLGLEHALKAIGIDLQRAAVGDRYVMERLIKGGLTLGGESSGHIICLDRTTTGDGIISALQVMAEMHRSGEDLHTLKCGMRKYPQKMINVPIARRIELDACAPVQQALQRVNAQLSDRGRVLLRPSGTEPVVRVMVEGSDGAEVDALAHQLAEVVGEAMR